MDRFENRKLTLAGIFAVVTVIFMLRLFYIQVVDDRYKTSAENQAIRYSTQYANRGAIYDRHGELLAYNEAAYDLMVIPRQVLPDMDTLAFCQLIGLDTAMFNERIKTAREYSRYKPSAFEKQIPASQWAPIQEKLYRFPGFYGEKRTLRKYPDSTAAHVLGYISEVNQRHLNEDSYYRSGDYIGINGIESAYEEELRGKRGVKVYLVDVHNTIQGSYQNGALDSLPVSGIDLVSTLDKQLQSYGEKLMANKKGSIVAIEPSTGEILALVSAPAYDPNLLVGRDRSDNYSMLAENDSLNPLFNRAVDAVYRPGSIFKLVQSLVGQQLGVITPNSRIRCNRGIINCHGSHTNDDLAGAIQHSCNPYFHQVYKRIIQAGRADNIYDDSALGLEEWRKYVMSFGLGVRLETDLPNIHAGMVPGASFYNRWYGERRWAFSTIYSNSIGEGELGVIPLQMANLAAILANRGYYYTPHLIREIGDNPKREEYREKNYTLVDSVYFTTVIDALDAVVNGTGGTAGRARIDSIVVCGKTGTVQNKNSPDHSVFMAFAPKENPQIAIAVYVEDAGWGGSWAAPIASLMIEKYLRGEIKNQYKEDRIVEANFLDVKKTGETH